MNCQALRSPCHWSRRRSPGSCRPRALHCRSRDAHRRCRTSCRRRRPCRTGSSGSPARPCRPAWRRPWCCRDGRQEEQVLRFGSVHGDQAAVEQDVLQRVVRAHQIAAVLGPGQGSVLPEDRGLHLHRLHRELTRSRTRTCPSRGPSFPALFCQEDR